MLIESSDTRDRDFKFFMCSDMLRHRWSYICALKDIGEDIKKLSNNTDKQSKKQIKELNKKRSTIAKKAIKRFGIKTGYCKQCQVPMVFCNLCGNNCCNGTSGSYKRLPNMFLSYEEYKLHYPRVTKEIFDTVAVNGKVEECVTEKVRCTDDCMLAYAINDSLQISDYPMRHQIRFFVGYIVNILDCKVLKGISNIAHKIIKQIRIGK